MTKKQSSYSLIKGKFFNEITEDGMARAHRAYPHYNFRINAQGAPFEVNINVFNRVPEHPELRVFTTSDPAAELINKTPFLNALALSEGSYAHIGKDLSLDYLRGHYFALERLKVPFSPAGEQEQDFLIQLLKTHLQSAQQNNWDICVWGNGYSDTSAEQTRNGIHDIHMNQGSSDRAQNSIWHDGALVITDDKDIRFACFLAFITQCLTTDDQGNCR